MPEDDLREDWIAPLVQGSGHIVGMVAADGSPFATRGWGIRLLDGGRRVRVVLAADEAAALGHPAGGAGGTSMALTATDIRTFRSIQVKGPVGWIGPWDDDDRAASAQYVEDYFAAVEEADGFPRALMERALPDDFVACEFTVVEAYDQTPGPAAGRSMWSRAGP